MLYDAVSMSRVTPNAAASPAPPSPGAYTPDTSQPVPQMHGRPVLSEFTHHACAAAWIARVHPETFLPLRGALAGQSVAILGSGPSLTQAPLLTGCRTIACNRTAYYLHERGVHADYYFSQDNNAVSSYIEEVIALLPGDCIIMLGTFLAPDIPPGWNIPTHVRADPRVSSYATGFGLGTVPRPELENFPLADYTSVVHPALHFALYAGAARIYLLGCDATSAGYYDARWQQAPVADAQLTQLRQGWGIMAALQQAYWPQTHIISVNPVGLRGMFEEVWTAGWLQAQGLDPRGLQVVESI